MDAEDYVVLSKPKVNKNNGEFTNDAAENVKSGAIKYDGGKAPIYRGAISYFPRAISTVAEVSAFGASKYEWAGWRNVEDGLARYTDAMVRHLVAEGKGEVLGPDSGLLHAAHTAWNALARLELMLREQEQEKFSTIKVGDKVTFDPALNIPNGTIKSITIPAGCEDVTEFKYTFWGVDERD